MRVYPAPMRRRPEDVAYCRGTSGRPAAVAGPCTPARWPAKPAARCGLRRPGPIRVGTAAASRALCRPGTRAPEGPRSARAARSAGRAHRPCR